MTLNNARSHAAAHGVSMEWNGSIQMWALHYDRQNSERKGGPERIVEYVTRSVLKPLSADDFNRLYIETDWAQYQPE